MREYWITISVQVEAHDHEEAQDIARDFIAHGKSGTAFKLEAEIAEIEET